jgi:hypothetical protein
LSLTDLELNYLVYPKDLADWARANESVEKIKSGAGTGTVRMRCEGGQRCPQSGFWFTPAAANSRCAFEIGAVMPIALPPAFVAL